MGKNFSRNNASGKRKESDFYETPTCLTSIFMDADREAWNKQHTILEPACGHGAISRVLRERGYSVVEYDIVQNGADFLLDFNMWGQMITNPPYSLAQEFILQAKANITDRFAMLLPLTYLQGSRRYKDIWSDKEFPLDRIYVFNRYPMFGLPLREDGKIQTGMQTYAWFVWEKFGDRSEPIIRWLDIDKYILKKGDKK